MINCKLSNIFIIQYEKETKLIKKHVICSNLIEATTFFKERYPNEKLISVALAAECTVLNTYELNMTEGIS